MWQEKQRKSVHSLLRELILNGQKMCGVTWRYYYNCWICLFIISLVHWLDFISLRSYIYLEFRSAPIVVLMKGTWPLTVGIWWVVLKVVFFFCSLPHLIGIAIILSNYFFHCRPAEAVEMNCPNVLFAANGSKFVSHSGNELSTRPWSRNWNLN